MLEDACSVTPKFKVILYYKKSKEKDKIVE